MEQRYEGELKSKGDAHIRATHLIKGGFTRGDQSVCKFNPATKVKAINYGDFFIEVYFSYYTQITSVLSLC